jgi:hypothetical protein
VDINVKELWVITHQLIPRESPSWHGRRVLVRCDNRAAVSYLKKRRGAIYKLASLLNGLEDLERERKFAILALHIKGKANVIADNASRDRHFASAWNADPSRDLRIKPSSFLQVQDRLGLQFTVDAWASHDGLNAVAPVWFHAANSAFIAPLANEVVWAFPPQTVIREWLVRVPESGAKAICTVVLANPRALHANFVSRVIPQFDRICTWPKGSKVFLEPLPKCRAPGAFPKAVRSDLEVWVLVWPKGLLKLNASNSVPVP